MLGRVIEVSLLKKCNYSNLLIWFYVDNNFYYKILFLFLFKGSSFN